MTDDTIDTTECITNAAEWLERAREQGIVADEFAQGGQADLTLAAAQANIEQVAEELDG